MLGLVQWERCASQEPAGHFVWHRRAPGARNAVVKGSAWEGTTKLAHKQVGIDAVEKEVAKENPTHVHMNAEPMKIKEPSERALVNHFSKRTLRATAPAPAPGPAPWTEDPQWMVDGARGDKTKTVPITDQFKGLEKLGAPEQGFHGRPVRHANGDSYSTDFTNEFGPGVKDAFQVCMMKEHRSDYWCKIHMKDLMIGSEEGEKYAEDQGLEDPPKSNARSRGLSAVLLAGAALMWAWA